jgi:hypothetical protein
LILEKTIAKIANTGSLKDGVSSDLKNKKKI